MPDQIPFPKCHKRLPTVLSQQEVARLIDASGSLMHSAMIMTLYATGVRRAELCRLKVSDIDSERMVLHIQQGKGARDRDVPLSPKLLGILREYWLWMKPRTYLFPGMENNWRADVPITENAEDALAATLLLIALLTNGGYKPILVIDQFEKLLVSTEPITKKRNEGYLRSMIEGLRARNALLILSGSSDGWNCLADDVKSRIGQRVIECPALSLDEACDLLRMYLIPADAAFVPGRGGIHPLTLSSVKEMLTLSAGNPRKLLQFSH